MRKTKNMKRLVSVLSANAMLVIISVARVFRDQQVATLDESCKKEGSLFEWNEVPGLDDSEMSIEMWQAAVSLNGSIGALEHKTTILEGA